MELESILNETYVGTKNFTAERSVSMVSYKLIIYFVNSSNKNIKFVFLQF